MEEQTKENEQKLNTTETGANNSTDSKKGEEKSSGPNIVLIIAAVILVIAALVYLFIRLSPETTGKIRDVSLVLYVLESVVTVVALTVLIIQVTKLISYLKYELQPILDTTLKTTKKISGTVSFLCENTVTPTINTASRITGVKKAADTVLSLFKK